MELNYLFQIITGKTYNRNVLWFLTLISLFPSKTIGQTKDIVNVADIRSGELFNSYVDVFETVEDIPVEDVISRIENHSISISKNNISQGFSENIYWVYFELNYEEANESQKRYLLELDNPHIDKYDFYHINNDTISKISSGGDHYPFQNRKYDSETFIFPLELESRYNAFILKIDKRKSSIRFPLIIWESNEFKKYQLAQKKIHGVFFGFIFLIVIASLGIAYFLKNKLFAIYGMYILLLFLFIFTTNGYSFKYLYPNQAVLNDYVRLLLTLANTLIASYYILLFINLKKHRPRNILVLKVSALSFLLIFCIWIIFPTWVRSNGLVFLNIFYFLIFVLGLIITVSAIQVYPIEKKNVITLSVSFTFSVLGTFGFILLEYGVVEQSFFIIDPVSAGLGIEILLLSIAMGIRVKKIVGDVKNIEADNEEQEQRNLLLKENNGINANSVIRLNEKNVNFSDIRFIKSDGHYLRFCLQNQIQPVLVRMSTKEIIAVLPLLKFVQIHRSYIVNIDFVKIKYATKLVLKDNVELPVSRSFKNEVQNLTIQT